MKSLLAGLGLLLVSLGTAAQARAESFGPFCWGFSGFSNQLVLFFLPNGGNQFLISGRDIGNGNRAVTGSAFVIGPSLVVGFTLHAREASANSTIGGATLSLTNGGGPGFARSTSGRTFTFTMNQIGCPPGATTDLPE